MSTEWLRRQQGSRPLVYGHRGAPLTFPENTLAGFALALDQGADGVELDVRLCASGDVVVFHDRDLHRVANDSGVVAALSLDELRARDLGQGQRVSTLHEVIDLVRGRDRIVNIEIKSDVPDQDALCAAVADCLYARSEADCARLFVSTFHPAIVHGLRRYNVALPIAFLFEQLDVGYAGIEALKPDGSHPDRQLTVESDVAAWKRDDLFVNVWTVNDPARAMELATWGVDGLITDDVPTVLSAFA